MSGLHVEMNALAHYQNQLLAERDDQLESARRSIEDLENRLAGSNARLEQVSNRNDIRLGAEDYNTFV